VKDNRQRLIEAALAAIADVGYAATSVSEITRRAGLSRGMIHLHFKGKDALIAEAARIASDAYHAHLEAAVAAAGPAPAARIRAIIAGDLSPQIMNPRSVGIWYELRGAARTRPEIALHAGTRGGPLETWLKADFLALDPGDAPCAGAAARGTIALLEGTWTDFMLAPDGYDAAAAEGMIHRFLHGLYPAGF